MAVFCPLKVESCFWSPLVLYIWMCPGSPSPGCPLSSCQSFPATCLHHRRTQYGSGLALFLFLMYSEPSSFLFIFLNCVPHVLGIQNENKIEATAVLCFEMGPGVSFFPWIIHSVLPYFDFSSAVTLICPWLAWGSKITVKSYILGDWALSSSRGPWVQGSGSSWGRKLVG